jgi:hypothetical protein
VDELRSGFENLLNLVLAILDFLMSDTFSSEFNEVVNDAVLRVAGLPDAEFADRLLALAGDFENVIRESAPRLTDGELTILRQHFLATVASRCNMLVEN